MKLSIGLLMVLLVFGSFASSPLDNTAVVVIVNSKNPIERMTPTIVRVYWLRASKKRWPETSKAIKPVDRKAKCAEKDLFLSKIVSMSAADVDNYFAAKQYQFAEAPPEKFSSDMEIIDFVSREEGAIAYVNKGVVTQANNTNVKIVFEF